MICHENKLILIHFEKCGGTSISNFFTNKEWWDVHNQYLFKIRYDDGHEKHLKYDIAKQIYTDYIKDYKIITIARHPYTLFVSKFLFNYRLSKTETVIFEKDVVNIIAQYKQRWNISDLYDFYSDKKYYDFVIKFENYKQDFYNMCNSLGINLNNKTLKHINIKNENEKNSIIIEKKAKKMIREYCKEYCDAFGYNIQ
jgi:hypothetical protein